MDGFTAQSNVGWRGRPSKLNIEDDLDTSPEAQLLWEWNPLLSMYAVSMDDENDDIDCKDYPPQVEDSRFGVFLTQSMCDWLVDQADSYEGATPMSDRIRNLIWGQKRLLRKSGGVLITNQHFGCLLDDADFTTSVINFAHAGLNFLTSCVGISGKADWKARPVRTS